MSEEPISLGSLAYACNVYDAMTDFGSSFREFQRRVHGKPDLDDPDHRRALLKWLNAWGCRHLALACHDNVSKNSPRGTRLLEIGFQALPIASRT